MDIVIPVIFSILSTVFHSNDVSCFVLNRKGSVPCMWQQSTARWRWPVSSCRRGLHPMLPERWDVVKEKSCSTLCERVSLNLDHQLKVFLYVLLLENMSWLNREGPGTHRTLHIGQEMTLLHRAAGVWTQIIITSNQQQGVSRSEFSNNPSKIMWTANRIIRVCMQKIVLYDKVQNIKNKMDMQLPSSPGDF